MPTHAEKRRLPYRQEQLFNLVADVEQYPEFLPWCVAARLRQREGDVIYADLVIGYKMFREQFSSKITLSPPNRIDVQYTRGPFRYLNNHWIFIPEGEDVTCIDFYVDFEFNSRFLQRVVGVMFNEAVRRMVRAFEARAAQLYGPPGAAATAGGE